MNIMAVLGGGGHTAETLALVNRFKENRYYYLIDVFDKLSSKKIKENGRVLKVLNPRGSEDDNKLVAVLKLFVTMLLSLYYIMINKPDVVLAVGGSSAYPTLMMANMFCKKTLYVESIARVQTLSWTGKLLYGKVDLFCVQWPENLRFTKMIYIGSVL